jgi:hypothetical protein
MLRNVPAHKNYTFLVAVYDDDLEEWSQVSDESNTVQMKIGKFKELAEFCIESNFVFEI